MHLLKNGFHQTTGNSHTARLSPARGHGQRGDAREVAASGGDELVRLGRAGGINGQQKARQETGGRRRMTGVNERDGRTHVPWRSG